MKRSKLGRKGIRLQKIVFLIILLLVGVVIVEIFNRPQKIQMTDLVEARESIINTNEGTTYYVASNGTSLNGTDINDPMSLKTANQKTYLSNDKVLFKCGDTFYGQVNLKLADDEEGLLYIGNYGEGEAPIISGATILKKENCWEQETENIYKLDLSKTENFEGLGNIGINSYNVGFIEDENNNLYGNRKRSLEELTDNYDFYCKNNFLYIKSPNNPDITLGKMKYAVRYTLVNLYRNVIISGLNVQYAGAHGIDAIDCNENIYIRDCIIQKIGGSLLSTEDFVRYGNAIQFWNAAKNTLVENCVIKDVYDTGYTVQGNGCTEGASNNICRNCIFINCSYTNEISYRNQYDYKIKLSIENQQFINNISINQGKGWGGAVRENKYVAAEFVLWNTRASDSNIEIKNNKYFNSTRLAYTSSLSADSVKKSALSNNNIIYLNKDTYMIKDDGNYADKSILEEFGFENDSTFRVLSDDEVKKVSNQVIFNSNDYNEIKLYYEKLEKEFAYPDILKLLINQYEIFKDEFSDEISNISGLKTQINKIQQNMQKLDYNSDTDYTLEQLENTYKLTELVKASNVANKIELIKGIEEIGKKYKEIIEIKETKQQTVDINEILDKINYLNTLIDIYENENIDEAKQLKELITIYQIGMNTSDNYLKKYNYISAKYLLNYAVQSIEEQVSIKSDKYVVDNYLIKGISNNTTCKQLKDNLNTYLKYDIKRGNTVVKDNDILATGDVLQLKNTDKQYEIAVAGDLNKDGEVDIKDLVKIRKTILGLTELSGVEEHAADANMDNKDIGINDLVKIRKIILGM